SDYWVNFARTGNPNGKGLPVWTAYNEASEPYMDFGDPVQMRNHLLKEQLDFQEQFQRHRLEERASREERISAMKHFGLLRAVLLTVQPCPRQRTETSRPAPVPSGLPVAKPEEVGMSADRLARIRTSMQRYVDRGEVPGVVTLVARRGRVVHFDAVGYRDAES